MPEENVWALYPQELPAPFDSNYSFSKLQVMDGCLARGGVVRELASMFRTTNEYALLGQVVHRYVEQLALQRGRDVSLWDAVCEQVYQEARATAIADPPRPEKWAGYQAKRVAAEKRLVAHETGLIHEGKTDMLWHHEVQLVHPSEPYFGILDLLRYGANDTIEILDLKTGPTQTPPSLSHARQLGFYGYIAEAALGKKVSQLGILSASGSQHLVDNVSETIRDSLSWASGVRKLYEKSKESWSLLFSEAKPSVENCRGCELRPKCTGYLQDSKLHRATGFVSGFVSAAGVAANRSAWAEVSTDAAGSLVHISGLPMAPELGTTIAVMEGRYSSDNSIKVEWNSRLAVISSD